MLLNQVYGTSVRIGPDTELQSRMHDTCYLLGFCAASIGGGNGMSQVTLNAGEAWCFCPIWIRQLQLRVSPITNSCIQ